MHSKRACFADNAENQDGAIAGDAAVRPRCAERRLLTTIVDRMASPNSHTGPAQKRPRTHCLPSGIGVHDVADACRKAVFEFLSGAGTGWSRKDLVFWLVGPYRRATSASPELPEGRRRTTLGGPGSLDEAGVEKMLLRSRERVLEMLRDCKTSWESADFAREAIDAGVVVRVRDEVGSMGHAPVEHPEMPLADRVGSLVIADYLTRPADYRDLVICDDCGEAGFEWDPRHQAHCVEPRAETESGLAPRYATPPMGLWLAGEGGSHD
jgi:hypothetical protein